MPQSSTVKRESNLQFLRGEERRKLTVAGLVSEAAQKSPHAVALTHGLASLSYGELNARANRLARYLRRCGASSEALVGICLDRSFDQIVSILAVLKAGAAFLPIDPHWPVERIRNLLDDAQVQIVVAGVAQQAVLADRDRIVVDPQRDKDRIENFESHDDDCIRSRDHLAYVIYTSGSSGEPKGVEVTHGNLLNLIFWHRTAFGVTSADRASHLAGLGFDASVWEVWPYLTAGASVALADEDVRTSPDLLQRWIVDRRINIAFVPTALAEPMLTADWPCDTALRFLLTGAETLRSRPRAELPFAFVNNYGPTECAVVATSGLVTPARGEDQLPPIGAPIANTSIYLLNESCEPVEAGHVGEIYIGGTSVGRGYRNRHELTAERFLPDPFEKRPGARMYRTGDLGRRLPDGQITFHGRIDHQEKIRGHRVEPDEVAAILNRHPQVVASAVIARDDTNRDKKLVAYVIAAAGSEPSAADLHEFAAGLLPDYMVPAAFVRLETLPVTSSGKLDRKALPEPTADNTLTQIAFRAPSTPVELHLAEIVTSVLGTQIGIDDNFFMVGGHSLLGTQVVMRAREAFGADVTLRHLFGAPTIAQLAVVIEMLVVAKIEAMSDAEVEQHAAS